MRPGWCESGGLARELVAEGFPGMTRAEFVEFCATHRGIAPNNEVTRIEWVYPASDESECAAPMSG